MAIALHLKKTYAGDTRYMTSGKCRFKPECVWDNYLAFLELRKSPKFDTSPSKSVLKSPPKFASANVQGEVEDNLPAPDEDANGALVDAYEQPSRTVSVGQKKAKLAMKESSDKKEAVKLMSDKMDKSCVIT
jgi:hypothetical protein